MAAVTQQEPARATPPQAAPTVWTTFLNAIMVAIILLLAGVATCVVFGIGVDTFVSADAKRVTEREKILADRNAEDFKLLHDPAGWLDKTKGIVRVPIGDAMTMVLADLQKNQPHADYPISQSPPQPAAAPTSPDKGAGAAQAGNAINPPASNPTVGQPSSVPAVAGSSTPAPATGASNAPDAPSATPAPTGTPLTTDRATGVQAPSTDNNANNPGKPPVPGTNLQPTPTPAPSLAPNTSSGSKPEPLMTPPAQPTPASATTPIPSDHAIPTPAKTEPGASPVGTP